MRRLYAQLLIVALTLMCFIVPCTATAQRFIDKAKSPIAGTIPDGEVIDIIMLDSIISDNERVFFEYNDFGYLKSKMTYRNEGGGWTLQTNDDESFLAEYTFDNQNRCTGYSQYKYTTNGTKGIKIYSIEVEYIGNIRHEKHYEFDEYDAEALVLESEITYDKYGNPSIFKDYDYSTNAQKPILDDYEEYRFTGNVITYEYCENGNYAIEFDEELFEELCYYQISYDSDENHLRGTKYETAPDGTKVTYTINEWDFYISELDNIDNYWVLEEDEDDNNYGGDISEGEIYEEKAANAARFRIEDYETGKNWIEYKDNEWRYEGNISIEEIFNEATESYEKSIVSGDIYITWIGNGAYRYTHPSENYQFPCGALIGVSKMDYSMAIPIRTLIVIWDEEEKGWRLETKRVGDITKHYNNDKGQVVEETSEYRFNGETLRMEVISGTTKTTTYSFNEQADIAQIVAPTYTKHFEYLDGTNYLKKEYITDSQGNKSDVCTYHYSNGKYTWPITNATCIKEIASAKINIDGNRITADGNIRIFTPCGQLAAEGKGNVTVNSKGLYIVEVDGKVCKISIK